MRYIGKMELAALSCEKAHGGHYSDGATSTPGKQALIGFAEFAVGACGRALASGAIGHLSRLGFVWDGAYKS